MMGINEVGDGVSAEILTDWLGEWAVLFPVWTLMVGMFALVGGILLWLMVVFEHNWVWDTMLVVSCILIAAYGLWFQNLVSSVWLTIAHGETSLEDGYKRANRLQSITVQEIRAELDKYIIDSYGVENIDLHTFKTRLRIIDPDEGTIGEEGEQVVKLGTVTEKLAERLFEQKIAEGVKACLATVAGKNAHDQGTETVAAAQAGENLEKLSRPLDGPFSNDGGRDDPAEEEGYNKVEKLDKDGVTRLVVEDHLTSKIESEAQRIRMTTSQKLCFPGPLSYLMIRLGWTEWARENEWIDDWSNLDDPIKRDYSYWDFLDIGLFKSVKQPAPAVSMLNLYHVITFRFTEWGEGTPLELREQVISEQTNISLVAALTMTVVAGFILNIITPNGQGITNFPSEVPLNNWIIISLFSLSVLSYLLSTFGSIFLVMAMNEVGEEMNVLILIEWLGPRKLFPIRMFLLAMIFMSFGFVTWLLTVYRPAESLGNIHMWVIILFTVFCTFATTVWFLNLVSSVWLTLAHGCDNLTDGYGKALATQSISMNEIAEELDQYVSDAGGVEFINLETFKLRLRIIDPEKTAYGEEGEDVISLGQVTERLAEQFYAQRIKEDAGRFLDADAMKALDQNLKEDADASEE